MKNREIERKIEVHNTGFEYLTSIVADYLWEKDLKAEVKKDSGGDYYWALSGTDGADFFRLRRLGDHKTELTIKAKDKGNNFNRLEVNIPAQGSLNDVKDLFSKVMGPFSGHVFKNFYVFSLSEQNIEICTYTVETEDHPIRVFLEVEGHSEDAVSKITASLEKYLQDSQVEYDVCNQSLYEMYIKKEGV